ncbi:hypothetical protein [Streptosporangium sp. NPDC048865]|uniref:hypothetical protein n=1 Tax=Streptosporangium sp. NPDC048865 TaxID=3155766 RepID=UPI0034271383
MWTSLRFWGTALLGLAALPVIVIITQATDDLVPVRVPVWEVLRAGVMLLAGAWAGGRAQSRSIGRIFLLCGVLGVVQLMCELPGLVIVSDGTAASWEEWLHYWIWVPQVMAPLLLATAIFPDGRPALPIAVTFSILAIAMTSFTVATYNWPRSDGGAGYNPVFMFLRLPSYPSIIVTVVIVLVAAACVLASLVIRWRAGEAAVRRPLFCPLAALLLGIVYALLQPTLPAATGDIWEVFPPIYCAALALAVRPLRRQGRTWTHRSERP